MVGLQRPQFVLFGSSIVQLSYINEGWGAILAHIYARKKFWECNFHRAILCCDDSLQRMSQQGQPRANQCWRAPFSRSYPTRKRRHLLV
ncbi:hypothetical protein POPTR_016G115900v4 [Populus trichocarpa]|uniref:Uncharacterized protein n=1 Tax=Populus trichocarpa TaxID=3694 RepID=B9IG92_POPTR|nr:hypothetical protein BDE02_16G103700 [Populus trichocarpa]PNS99120.1 hypothetical protein POPTR_016G115900v4 [Populus trichocarpa]